MNRNELIEYITRRITWCKDCDLTECVRELQEIKRKLIEEDES